MLEDFSLVIRGDEHVAILGPNGCGKSTLIKTITRECYPVAREGSSMTILGARPLGYLRVAFTAGDCVERPSVQSSGEASGRDVVLSGFFSSARIFPHHVVDPGHRELADAALAQLEISHLAQRPVCEMSNTSICTSTSYNSRIAECVGGRVELELICEPVFDYGRDPADWPLVDDDRHAADASGAGVTMRLRTDLALGIEGGRVRARHVAARRASRPLRALVGRGARGAGRLRRRRRAARRHRRGSGALVRHARGSPTTAGATRSSARRWRSRG